MSDPANLLVDDRPTPSLLHHLFPDSLELERTELVRELVSEQLQERFRRKHEVGESRVDTNIPVGMTTT